MFQPRWALLQERERGRGEATAKLVMRTKEGPTRFTVLQDLCCAIGVEKAGYFSGVVFSLFALEKPIGGDPAPARKCRTGDAHDPGGTGSLPLEDCNVIAVRCVDGHLDATRKG